MTEKITVKSPYWSPTNVAADLVRLLEQDYGDAARITRLENTSGCPMVRVVLASADARPLHITITRARR